MTSSVIAALTLRQSLARRRWMIVVALAALPVVMATLLRLYSVDEEPLVTFARMFTGLSLTVVVPIVALTLASAGFSAEIDDGTVIYLLAKPISRSQIVLVKLLVTSLVAVVLMSGSTLAAGFIALDGFDSTRLVLGFAVAASLGSFLYTAIFLALGLITRRGMLVGLIYLVVWEGVLSTLFAGTRSLSVRQYMLSVADAVASVDTSVLSAPLPHARAYTMSAVVACCAVGFCIRRLRAFEMGQTG